ncbi:MAG TPA: TonB-dependent receptor [Longimicrobiales bacterium]|nr:TonB-dependent receptor [Longimicrobiales bacterium]
MASREQGPNLPAIWLSLTIVLMLCGGGLAAQAPGALEGRVTSQLTGQPIDGVEVVIEAAGLGTLTNADGRYRLAGVPAGEHRVTTHHIGYGRGSQTVTVPAGGVVTLDFVLRDQAVELDAVVVTGQAAEISRRRLSTNADVVSEETIDNSPATRLDQLLQSALPSVQVRMSSGQPGATSVTRGRGPVSVSRSTTPVIYVDGVRVDNLNTQAELSLNTSGNRRQGTQTSSIADIPLENIERIEYVPGGAATTLYGSDAANGVIQIFTKKGTPGPTRLSVESEIGWESPVEKAFFFPQTADLLYRNGLTQKHQLAGSGGSENATWSFSGSVQDREGYRIDNNASKSYQARTGMSARLAETLQYSGSFGFGYNHYDRSRDGNAGGYTPLWLLEGGRIFALGFNNQLDEMEDAELESLREYVTRAEALQNYRIQVSRFQMSNAFRWDARTDLSFNSTLGLDFRSSNERGIETNEFLIHSGAFPEGTDDRGSIESYDRRFLGLTLEGGGQHTLNRGPLSLITAAGAQLFREDDAQSERVALNVRDGSETVRGAGTTIADDFFLEVVNYGAYVQQNWGFFDRYFLDVGLRADGNSAFGDAVGLQYYPKVGFSYDVGSEPFFQDGVFSDWISTLRLRGNYGVAGNFPPPFAHDRTVSFASYLGEQTAAFGQPGNPDLRPEKTHTLELGGELQALAGRLTLQFAWYDATTRDALFLVPSGPSTGQGVQMRNVGEIANHGIEIQVIGDVFRGENVRARVRASLNTLNNEVVDAGGSPVFGISGFSSSTVQTVVREGWPVGALRGTASTLNPDGTIATTELLQFLGKPLPDRFGSLGLELSVRDNIRFNADADWQTGAQLHSFNRQFRYLYGIDDPNLPAALMERNPGPFRLNWLALTNFFVEDTDYLRFRNIALSYSLPQDLVSRWADGVELRLAAQNLIGWWSSSFDPESDHSGAATQGGASVGGFNYASDPAPRTFLASVRVRF